MSSLGDRMRKAREFKREVDGKTLIMRRPNEAEYAKLERQGASGFDVALKFVIGWEGVTEADLVPSGGSDEVPFDYDAWGELLGSRRELWEVGKIIQDEFWQHQEKREERAKN